MDNVWELQRWDSDCGWIVEVAHSSLEACVESLGEIRPRRPPAVWRIDCPRPDRVTALDAATPEKIGDDHEA